MHAQDQECIWNYFMHLSAAIAALASGDYSQDEIVTVCTKIGQNCNQKLHDIDPNKYPL